MLEGGRFVETEKTNTGNDVVGIARAASFALIGFFIGTAITSLTSSRVVNEAGVDAGIGVKLGPELFGSGW